MTDSANDDSASSPSEVDAVRAVVLDYIEGWYQGDADRMDRALHDDLVKRTPLLGDASPTTDFGVVPKARMIELTLAGGGADVAEPAIEVFIDDLSGDIACARTVCADFVDYLQLAKTDQGWKIANILFRMLG